MDPDPDPDPIPISYHHLHIILQHGVCKPIDFFNFNFPSPTDRIRDRKGVEFIPQVSKNEIEIYLCVKIKDKYSIASFRRTF